MCNYDCLNCANTENCVLDEIELTEEELALSDEIDFLIKKEQSDEKIRQFLDDTVKGHMISIQYGLNRKL